MGNGGAAVDKSCLKLHLIHDNQPITIKGRSRRKRKPSKELTTVCYRYVASCSFFAASDFMIFNNFTVFMSKTLWYSWHWEVSTSTKNFNPYCFFLFFSKKQLRQLMFVKTQQTTYKGVNPSIRFSKIYSKISFFKSHFSFIHTAANVKELGAKKDSYCCLENWVAWDIIGKTGT